MTRMLVVMFIALTLFANSACSNKDEVSESSYPSDIIVKYDAADMKRIERFVDRFKEGKRDAFMAIPPIVDGGYWIYDFITDGSTVTMKVDSTRDSYAQGKVSTYTCQGVAIVKEKSGDGEMVDYLSVSDCDGAEKFEQGNVLALVPREQM